MKGFVDIHSHFVYGMDDGAQTPEDMYAMLDMANREGITALFATPHVTLGFRPFDGDAFQDRLAQARAYCYDRRYAIAIHPGAEMLYTPAMHRYIAQQRLPVLGDTDMALIEFSPDIPYAELAQTVAAMERAGYMPVLAHVERYRCLFHGANLRKLCEKHDIRCQMNANTVLSKQGFLRDRVISGWLKEQLIDFIASDAHNTTSRPFRQQQAWKALQNKCTPDYLNQLLLGDWSSKDEL